jgi:hypothetical protein
VATLKDSLGAEMVAAKKGSTELNKEQDKKVANSKGA